MCVRVCALEGRGGFKCARLPGSLLGLHSLKLFFYKGPCLAERGKPARIRRKGWASPVKDATVAMWGENTVVCFGTPQFNLVQVKLCIHPSLTAITAE